MYSKGQEQVELEIYQYILIAKMRNQEFRTWKERTNGEDQGSCRQHQWDET